MEKTNDVIGLGNTLVDFLVEIDEDKLLEYNVEKGKLVLVDEKNAQKILQQIEKHELTVEIVPGGSVANTMRAIGLLQGNVILCGKVGADKHGEMYVQELQNHNVNSKVKNHPKTTGHAVTFITPDSERSFSVHLGAALELYKEDILEEDIAKSKILHLEGYQLEGTTRETVLHAVNFAIKHNTLVSLDLSDGGVIQRNKEFVTEFLKKVDIVFANEVEAFDFTGLHGEEAARELGKYCQIAVVKVGAEGSYIFTEGRTTKIPGFPATPIDTTGAGDTFSAGFLYGYCHDWPLEKAGKLGSVLAAKIVEKKGVIFTQPEMIKIRDFVK